MTKKHKELSDLSTGLTPKHTEGKHAEQFHNVSNDENQRVFYLRANSETLKKAKLLALRKKMTISTLIEKLIQENYEKIKSEK